MLVAPQSNPDSREPDRIARPSSPRDMRPSVSTHGGSLLILGPMEWLTGGTGTDVAEAALNTGLHRRARVRQ